MGSSKRREARNRRQRRSGPTSPAFDPHAQVMVDSLTALMALMATFAGDDPAAAVDAAFDKAVDEIAAKVGRFDALRLIEVARQRFLPMAREGETPVTAEAGAAYLELLALVALAARQDSATAGALAVEDQEMSHFVSEAKDELDRILRLAQIRSFAAVDPTDKLALMSMLIPCAEVAPQAPLAAPASRRSGSDARPAADPAPAGPVRALRDQGPGQHLVDLGQFLFVGRRHLVVHRSTVGTGHPRRPPIHEPGPGCQARRTRGELRAAACRPEYPAGVRWTP
jgi:hypothetical protein